MSVEFAQQTELARINKRADQRCISMQTQSDEEELEEKVKNERTTASPSSGAWLEEVEKERLERELEERNAEIRKLKKELQKSGPEQVGVIIIIMFLFTLHTSFHLREFITAASLILRCTVSQCRCCIDYSSQYYSYIG